MDNDNLLIICRSCGRKSLMHNMKPDGEHMICSECAKKGASLSSEVSIQKKAIENEPFSGPRKKTESAKVTEKMLKYICSNCKYKFSRKESQHVEKCPYCGKNTVVHDSQLGAQNLIKDSMGKKFDW